MKKTFIILLLFFGAFFSGVAQDLIFEQDYKRTGTCFSLGTEACVTIIANNYLELTFESNVDSTLKIAEALVGQNIEYLIYLPTDKIEYFDRILTVYCPAFNKKVHIPLLLGPKDSEFYLVSATECFKPHFEKGVALFKKCLYNDAKEEFFIAKEDCFDTPPINDIAKRIKVIDSILMLQKLAKVTYELLDYKKAEVYYKQIHALNKDDSFAEQRYMECRNENINYCEMYINFAKNYELNHEYEKSKLLEKKALENKCNNDSNTEKLDVDIPNKEMSVQDFPNEQSKAKKREIAFAITYQWSWRAPFGISMGGYKDRKLSAYFTFLFNTEFFSTKQTKRAPEFDATIGLTARPVNNKYVPIWLTIGAGYTGITNIKGSSFYHAFSPEIGVLIKIPFGREPKAGLAIKYNFQYRVELFSHGIIKPVNHAVGLGFCF